MKSEDYLKLQVGMYITDKNLSEGVLPFDYCLILSFLDGVLTLQPLDDHGKPNGHPFKIHYKELKLTDSMHRSDFVEMFPECKTSAEVMPQQ